MAGVITDPAKCDGLRVSQRCTSEDDLGYFQKYPAAMYEAMTRLSPSSVINSTTPNYGPLLYTLGRVIGVQNVLEIGVAQGWSSGFMAWAVKENNVRYGMTGSYYGIDVQPKPDLARHAAELELPMQLIIHPQGSVDFLEQQTLWQPESFDLIFIDGWHNTEYVAKEVALCYPLLKSRGLGYLVMHDIYAYCEEVWKLVVESQHFAWESLRFFDNYGLGILRKMAGYDHAKVHWPEGDQAQAEGFLV